MLIPPPQFYWVTPTGDKVSSEAEAAPIISQEGRGLSRRKKKHRMLEPGLLVIEHAEPSDAGVYTCVAWNVEGADTKSVSVFVDSRGSGRSWWRDEPSIEQLWMGNWSLSEASLVVLAKVVHAQSVVLEWKVYPSKRASSLGQYQHEVPLPLPWWTSATVHIDNPQISYTAKQSKCTGLGAANETGGGKVWMNVKVLGQGSLGNFMEVGGLWR
ncbi:leucine-rich repeat neuronal protein 1-like [Xenentodon cancila]